MFACACSAFSRRARAILSGSRADVFDDVPLDHPFCTQITWLAHGVTLGCKGWPGHRFSACKMRNAMMAAFLQRLANACFRSMH
jgi:hypothetical protein